MDGYVKLYDELLAESRQSSARMRESARPAAGGGEGPIDLAEDGIPMKASKDAPPAAAAGEKPDLSGEEMAAALAADGLPMLARESTLSERTTYRLRNASPGVRGMATALAGLSERVAEGERIVSESPIPLRVDRGDLEGAVRMAGEFAEGELEAMTPEEMTAALAEDGVPLMGAKPELDLSKVEAPLEGVPQVRTPGPKPTAEVQAEVAADQAALQAAGLAA